MKGYKITNQRKSIIEVFIQSHDNLLSAQEVYERVLKTYPGLNFSTIYRNLEVLERIEIIHKILTGENHGLYKLKEENAHHHHFICKDCGKTEVIQYCPFHELEEKLREKNLLPTEHHFEIFGFCEKCIHKKGEKS